RGARVGRAELLHRLALFRDFLGLDRQADLAAGLVDAGDQRIDLVALAEAFRALVATVAGQVGAADEGAHAALQLHLDAAVIDLGHRAGDDLVLAQGAAAGAGLLDRIILDLLDAERDALLLHIDIENL